MRTLVIGDIHGAFKALQYVLKECNFNYKKDKLIFLGDYVDGWSESPQVIEFLIKLQEISVFKPVFIRGNHDMWCDIWLNTGVEHPYWGPNGGNETKVAYIETGLLAEESHRKFFRLLNNYYKDNDNRVFVHGGFTSRKGIGHDAHNSNYCWDRDMWGLAIAFDKSQLYLKNIDNYLRFKKHKEIFIGHTSTTNWICDPDLPEFKDDKQIFKDSEITVPMKRCNVWNLDTGAGFNGKLTIMDIDTKEYWQSPTVSKMYPNEKGRQ